MQTGSFILAERQEGGVIQEKKNSKSAFSDAPAVDKTW